MTEIEKRRSFTTADADRLLDLADDGLAGHADYLAENAGGLPLLALVGDEADKLSSLRREWEAIRPLFVQAPALLAALKSARAALVIAISAACDLPEFDVETHVIVVKIDAVIASAEAAA